MKKLATLILSLIAFSNTFACDICGGGLGSNYLGLLPDFNKRFIGVRYHYNDLYTQLDIDGQKTTLTNKEKYKTIDLWGAWNISDKWRVMAIIPFSNIQKYNYGSDITSSKKGLGDITTSIYYNLFNSSKNLNDKLLNQNIWIGTGLKFFTGTYNSNELISTNSPNIYQLGTGSNDILVYANYDIRLQNTGINISSNYKINTTNKDEYKYGNKLTVNGSLYHKVSFNENARITPNIGINYEAQANDYSHSFKIDETGGRNLNASVGIEANLGNFALGLVAQKPISQNLNSGRTELNNKISSHLSYTF